MKNILMFIVDVFIFIIAIIEAFQEGMRYANDKLKVTKERIVMSRIDFKYRIRRNQEKVVRWVVWHLPRKVVMWSFYRVLAHATTGKYGKTIVSEITAMDAVDRWIKDYKL